MAAIQSHPLAGIRLHPLLQYVDKSLPDQELQRIYNELMTERARNAACAVNQLYQLYEQDDVVNNSLLSKVKHLSAAIKQRNKSEKCLKRDFLQTCREALSTAVQAAEILASKIGPIERQSIIQALEHISTAFHDLGFTEQSRESLARAEKILERDPSLVGRVSQALDLSDYYHLVGYTGNACSILQKALALTQEKTFPVNAGGQIYQKMIHEKYASYGVVRFA